MTPGDAGGFRDYLTQYQQLPPGCTLGFLAWYSVADGSYDPATLEQLFIKHGLSMNFLPPDINPADAFEKAAKSVDNTRYDLDSPPTLATLGAPKTDHYAVILVREAKRDKEKVVRKLIREIRDSKNARLKHEEMGEFVFYRPIVRNGQVDYTSWRSRRQITGTPVSNAEHRALTDMLRKFDDQFARYLKFHDGQKLRTVIRGYLLYLNAIAMKDSVYFVHNTRSTELLALQAMVAELGEKGTSIVLAPQVDLPSMRQEVIEAFEREAVEDLFKIAKKMDDLKSTRKGPVSISAYTNFMTEFQGVMAKAGEYTRTLQISQDATADAALLVQDKLAQLQNEIAGKLLAQTEA